MKCSLALAALSSMTRHLTLLPVLYVLQISLSVYNVIYVAKTTTSITEQEKSRVSSNYLSYVATICLGLYEQVVIDLWSEAIPILYVSGGFILD